MFDKICPVGGINKSEVAAVIPLASSDNRLRSTEILTEDLSPGKPGTPALEGAPRHPDARSAINKLPTAAR